MTLTGGKRKVNKGLRDWVAFVKKVQKEEKLTYKDAIHRAKQRKDKGEKWMSGGSHGEVHAYSPHHSAHGKVGGDVDDADVVSPTDDTDSDDEDEDDDYDKDTAENSIGGRRSSRRRRVGGRRTAKRSRKVGGKRRSARRGRKSRTVRR